MNIAPLQSLQSLQSFNQFITLTEEKQVGILYHYTHIDSLFQILDENTLGENPKRYVSFTRNKNFHASGRIGVVTFCRLVIDGNKLSRQYRIRPFNYFPDSYHHRLMSYEAEERIQGIIRNIKDYIIEIDVSKKSLDNMLDDIDIDVLGKRYTNSEEIFDAVYDHIHDTLNLDIPVRLI